MCTFCSKLVISRKITGWVTEGSKLWTAANKWSFTRAAKIQEMEGLPGCSFTRKINIAAWSLTSIFRVFMQITQEKRDLPFCEMGEYGQVAGEERKIKGYMLNQARLDFVSAQKVWRETILRNVAWLWKCAFPKSSAWLMVHLQESRTWACTHCKHQEGASVWQLAPVPLMAA